MRRSQFIAILVAAHVAGCYQSSLPSSDDKNITRIEATQPRPPQRKDRKVVAITDSAVEKFKAVLEGDTSKYIRLSVKSEGPTGFKYDLKVDETPLNDVDLVDSSYGFRLVVDQRSSLFLEGATIGWEIQPDGKAGFKFDNPNALKK